MNYKKKLYGIIFLSLIGFGAGTFFFNLCDLRLDIPRCYDLEELGSVFSLFSIAIFFLSLILFALREEIFFAWKKFAKVYLSIASAIILLFVFSAGGGGNFGLGSGMDTEGATWILSGFFLIASLLIISIKLWKLRKTNQKV